MQADTIQVRGKAMNEAIGFVLSTLISASILWVAMKITSVRGSWLHLLLAAAIANAVGLIPVTIFGAFLPILVLVYLISKWTSAEVWPDAVLMVIIAWGLTWVLSLLVISRLLRSI